MQQLSLVQRVVIAANVLVLRGHSPECHMAPSLERRLLQGCDRAGSGCCKPEIRGQQEERSCDSASQAATVVLARWTSAVASRSHVGVALQHARAWWAYELPPESCRMLCYNMLCRRKLIPPLELHEGMGRESGMLLCNLCRCFFATYADVAYMGIEEMAWSTQQEDQTGSY